MESGGCGMVNDPGNDPHGRLVTTIWLGKHVQELVKHSSKQMTRSSFNVITSASWKSLICEKKT